MEGKGKSREETKVPVAFNPWRNCSCCALVSKMHFGIFTLIFVLLQLKAPTWICAVNPVQSEEEGSACYRDRI